MRDITLHHEVGRRLGLLVVLTVALLLVAPLWAPLLEGPRLSYNNQPFPVVSQTVRAGEPLVITVERCNHTDQEMSYTFSRALQRVDTSETFVLPGGAAFVPPGCETTTSRLHVIPPDQPPGRYYLRGLTDVPTRFGTTSIPWRTQTFEVVAPDGGGGSGG